MGRLVITHVLSDEDTGDPLRYKVITSILFDRHGARLDAADDEWQAHSQTPYDSPLSYGGWTQTRALGARIASLLQSRADSQTDDVERSRRRRQSDASSAHRSLSRDQLPQPMKIKRKTKVVIHSSPFLRCVQSSIAISAGMAQYHGNLVRLESRPKSPDTPKGFSSHSRAQTLDSKAFEERYLGRNATNELVPQSSAEEDASVDYTRPVFRVDACLGEWLSPDYYDFTTAPPPSNMMVALAKAELLKSAEPLQGAKIFEPDGSVTEFPGGGANGKPVRHDRPRSSTISMDALARVMPGSASGGLSLHTQRSNEDGASISRSTSARSGHQYSGYIPPTPTYALLSSEPIPSGYVAHARDACIEIDFAWDSMREPQNWGDGGTFGEEWGAMHRRFRGGLANMINWYKEKGLDFDPQDEEKLMDDPTSADDDSDVALVIMTHGAGCNALIGALTNQPVLMDVGMGSLTMAVHKPRGAIAQSPSDGRRNSSASFRRRRRSSVVDIGLSEDYDLKLMASTEHLRAGPDPLVIPQLAQSGAMPAIPEQSRRGSIEFFKGSRNAAVEEQFIREYAPNERQIAFFQKFQSLPISYDAYIKWPVEQQGDHYR
ncbi:MAG: hypothetical protein Q9162_003231 [Coniocarpon cinnabarinum]